LNKKSKNLGLPHLRMNYKWRAPGARLRIAIFRFKTPDTGALLVYSRDHYCRD
jgi:hypothetical protein